LQSTQQSSILDLRAVGEQVLIMNMNRNPSGKGGFRPGQSGNPGGRPAVAAELKALARQHTEAAINALVSIMNDKKASASARVMAAGALLDRGYGRPETKIEAEITRGEPNVFMQLPVEEIARIIDQCNAAGIEVREPELLEGPAGNEGG
jgi:hypothetical protein